jgi:hypothetical protein
VTPGSHSSKDCKKSGVWFTIGSFGDPGAGKNAEGKPIDPARPIKTGESDQQGTVSLSCSVRNEASGFRVVAQGTLSGATGGSFTISGLFRASGDNPGVSMSLSRLDGTYKQNDCVATYTTGDQTVDKGRAWATVTCPNAEDASAQSICEAVATFRVENCEQ